MDNTTLGMIYALKHAKEGYDQAIIDFWSKYTETPKEHYTKEHLMNFAVQAIRDYITPADNPSFVLWELFEHMHFDCKHIIKIDKGFDDRVRDAIWVTLAMTQVRKDGEYVNGFRDLPEEL